MSESKYNVVLLDGEGFELSSRPADTLKAAKADGKYLLSDNYARVIESTHADQRTHKIEVRDSAGEVVWDKFLS